MNKISFALVIVLIIGIFAACGKKNIGDNSNSMVSDDISDVVGTWRYTSLNDDGTPDGNYKEYTFKDDNTFEWNFNMYGENYRTGIYTIDKENALLTIETGKEYPRTMNLTGKWEFTYELSDDETKLTLHDIDYPADQQIYVYEKQ